MLFCLEKSEKILNGEVEKLIVGKLGVSGKNSCYYLCVTGSQVPLLSGCEVAVENFLGNLTGDSFSLEELHKLVGKALFNLFLNLGVLTLNVYVNCILACGGIHISKLNCGLGECKGCILCGLTLKLYCGKNNLSVLVDCVCRNNRSGFVGNHLDLGIDSQADIGKRS